MDDWKNISPSEREKAIRYDYHNTERRIYNLLNALCEVFGYYRELREELAEIDIYGAEDYYSTGDYSAISAENAYNISNNDAEDYTF